MTRLTGHVTLGDRRGLIDWTIAEDGSIESSGGVGAEQITVSGVSLILATEEEVLVTDNYDTLTVVDLKVLLTERSEPIYGNKEQLISRLRAWDAANPDGLSDAVVADEEPAVEDSGDSEEAAVTDESGDAVE